LYILFVFYIAFIVALSFIKPDIALFSYSAFGCKSVLTNQFHIPYRVWCEHFHFFNVPDYYTVFQKKIHSYYWL